ncbi:MAG: ATP-binding cassette domain-containing protein [Sporolactobacillus sp.]
MSYIELKDIHKSYKLSGKQTFPVLHGVDLKLERGEFVSILGESGGGKSTLMNIICIFNIFYFFGIQVENQR